MTQTELTQSDNFMSSAADFMANMEIISKFRNEIESFMNAKNEQDATISELKHKIEKIEKRQPVNPIIVSLITQMRRRHIVKLLGGKEAPAYKNSKIAQSVFRTAATDFKKKFKIPRYDLLKQEDEESAKEFWVNWQPSMGVQRLIEQENNYLGGY